MGQYFDQVPEVESHIVKRQVRIGDNEFSFYTDNGVFSKRGLDFGTRSLLENLPNLSGRILDFGCGYGPIGIYIKTIYPTDVDMIDINVRSLNLAKKNAQENGVDVHIYFSDTYQMVREVYDYIITNPPIRVGKKKLYEILYGAKKYLKKHGELWFVIHKDQGAKSILSDMEKQYQVELICKNKGFYIIRAINN